MKQNNLKSKSTLFKKKLIDNQKSNLLSINVKKTKTRQSKSKEKFTTIADVYAIPTKKFQTVNTKGDDTCRYTNRQLQKLKTFFETTEQQTLKTNRKSINNVKHLKNMQKKKSKSKSKEKSKSTTKKKIDEKTLKQLRQEFKKKINTFLPEKNQKVINKNKSNKNLQQYSKTTRAVSTRLEKNTPNSSNNKKKKQRHTIKSKTQLQSSKQNTQQRQLYRENDEFDKAIKEKYQFLFKDIDETQNHKYRIKIQQPYSQSEESSNCLKSIDSLKRQINSAKINRIDSIPIPIQNQQNIQSSSSLIEVVSKLQENQINSNDQYLIPPHQDKEQQILKKIQIYFTCFLQAIKFIKNSPKIPLSPITSPKTKQEKRNSSIQQSNLLSISQDFLIETVQHNKSIFQQFRTSNKRTNNKQVVKIMDFFKEQEDKWKRLKQSLEKLKRSKMSASGKHIDSIGQDELGNILLEVEKNHEAVKNLELIQLDQYKRQHEQIKQFNPITPLNDNLKKQTEMKNQSNKGQFFDKIEFNVNEDKIIDNQEKQEQKQEQKQKSSLSSNQFIQQQCPQFIRSPKLKDNQMHFQEFQFTQKDPQFTEFILFSPNPITQQIQEISHKNIPRKLSYEQAPLQITKLLRKKRPSNQQIQELSDQISRQISQKQLLKDIEVMESLSSHKEKIQQKLNVKNSANKQKQQSTEKQKQNSFIDGVLTFTSGEQIQKPHFNEILIQQFVEQVQQPNIIGYEIQQVKKQNKQAKLPLKNLFEMQAENQLIRMTEKITQQDRKKLADQIVEFQFQQFLYDCSVHMIENLLKYMNYNSILVQNEQQPQQLPQKSLQENDYYQYKVNSDFFTMKNFITTFFAYLSKNPQRVTEIKRRIRTPIGIKSQDLLKYMRRIKRQSQMEDEDDYSVQLQQESSPYQYIIDLESLIQFEQDDEDAVQTLENTVYQRAFNQSLFDFTNLILDQVRPYGQKGLPPICFPLQPQQYPQKSLQLMEKIVITKLQKIQQPEKIGQTEEQIQQSIRQKIKRMIAYSVQQMQKQLNNDQGNDFQIQFELMNLIQQQILLLQSAILIQHLCRQQQLFIDDN